MLVFMLPQNGYWKRWQLLKGGNAEGTLEWEETWWEASDWTGLKEMGARKEGEWLDTTQTSWHFCQCSHSGMFAAVYGSMCLTMHCKWW